MVDERMTDDIGREDGMDFAQKAGIGKRVAQRLHMEVGCRCWGRPYCAPHGGAGSTCEDHSGNPELSDPVPVAKLAPVEADDLAKDRAEQLIAALANALRARWPFALGDHLAVARDLLAHPYVRDALEPARAVVWAEPLGTIVSFRYNEARWTTSEADKATHLTVKIDPDVTVGADILGKKVAVAK